MSDAARAEGREPVVVAETSRGVHVRIRRAHTDSLGTVVCIHGALDGAASFLRVARRLSECDVALYDRRGYRASRDAGVVAGLDAHVDDALEVLGIAAAHGAAPPWVVLGHSYGGLVALGAVARSVRLGGFDGVVAYEPPFPWARPPDERHGVVGRDGDPGSVAEAFFRRIVGDGSWERLSEAARRARRLDGPALIEDLDVLGGAQPFDPRDVTVPTVIGLSSDAPERRGASALALARLIPTSRLEPFEGTGHGAHLTSPDRLAALVVGLLRTLGPKGAATGPAATP